MANKKTSQLVENCYNDLVSSSREIISIYLDQIDDVNDKVSFLESLDKYRKEGHQSPFCNTFHYCINLEIAKVIKDYHYCSFCNKYFPESDYKGITKIESRVEQVSTDSGYGDCDSFANVHRLNSYLVCPKCKKNNLVDTRITNIDESFTREELRSFLEDF